jgi:hypothetical protein
VKNGYRRGGSISAISLARSAEKMTSLSKWQWIADISRKNLRLAGICRFKPGEIIILKLL